MEAFAGAEACVTPVLDYAEAFADPHNAARGTLTTAGGVTQPARAPRYSISHTVPPTMATNRDEAATLADLGFTSSEIAQLGH